MRITFQLEGNKKLLPIEKVTTDINEEELYQQERANCNTIRLITTINPICSNVLYNPLTEVVYKEGSPSMYSYGYDTNGITIPDECPISGRTEFSGYTEMIRDTQLSQYEDIKYHCGLDIFNNHIMRNSSFKTVCLGNEDDAFNTLTDTMRYYNGSDVKGYKDNTDENIEGDPSIDKLHLYTTDDVLTFDESLEKNLKIENGWVGFKNASNMPIYYQNKKIPFNNVINNKQACEFICLAPEKDLFSFTPKYNKYKNRLEKNWHYYITYPSSATTNVPYIRKGTNSLKIVYFDENTRNSGSKSGIKIYSITKHGLNVDDVVNIYNGDELIIKNSHVLFVDDEHTFTCEKGGVVISDSWIDVNKDEWSDLAKGDITINGTNFSKNGNQLTIKSGITQYVTYILPNGSVNIDPNTQDITYKQVVSGEEVEYYVRIFSHLPNWRFATEKPTKYNIYKDGSSLIKDNQVDFENHISNLAFAKNAYGDDITQIVFTDDINIGELKDNLGRPLTEIYLTLLKNNKGYKEWYNTNNWENCKLTDGSIDIEYSHMFGKLNCGFNLSPHALKLEDDRMLGHITRMSNVDSMVLNGLANLDDDSTDEIYLYDYKDIEGKEYKKTKNYYGDLCCLSRVVYAEKVIDEAMGRFNTAQRESNWNLMPFKEDIKSDNYDVNNEFASSITYISSDIDTSEGYCYKMHYKIPIKTYSNELEYQYPEVSKIKKREKYLDEINDDKTSKTLFYSGSIFTDVEHYLEANDVFLLYDLYNNIWYNGEVIKVKSLYEFECKIHIDCNDKENNIPFTGITDDNRLQYRILRKESTIPDYALLTKDGTHRYIWRWILQNGNDSYSTNEIYPFTNGALYIHQNINVYVKRQDPNEYIPNFNGSYFKVSPVHFDVSRENNYKSEGDIVC